MSKPAQSLQKTIRTQKLRASCDACSLSKVRCNKEQPTCHRCATQKLPCKYSISRRMGKCSVSSEREARAVGTSMAIRGRQRKPSTAATSRFHSPEQAAAHTPADPPAAQPSFSDQLAASPFGAHLPEFEGIMPIGGQDTGYNTESSPDSSYLSGDLLSASAELILLESSMDLSNVSRMFEQPGDLQPTASFGSDQQSDDDLQSWFSAPGVIAHHGASKTSFVPLSPFSTPPNETQHQNRCTNLAFSTLNNLYLQSISHTSLASSSESYLPTFDQVLMNNKIAIDHVYTLLNCPCPPDPHQALLCALLSSKVLAWYQAIARVRPSSSNPCAEVVIDTPITFGAFQLDGEEEERMKAQLVLSELKKVAKLVEMFTERFCKAEEADRDPERDGAIYPALKAFLRSRLRTTVKEKASLLNRANGQ